MASTQDQFRGKIKLILVIGSLEGGGAERQIVTLANYWAAKGFSVTLATWSGPETKDFYCLHARVRRVHLQVDKDGLWFATLLENIQRVIALRRLLRSTQPTALLSFLTESNVLAILAGFGLKTRIVVSERVQPGSHAALPRTWKVLRRAVYMFADDVVAQSYEAAQWIARHCRKASIVIPNALRRLPDISLDRQPIIVAVGRLAHQKGFDLLLHAFARIASEFNDWNLIIIGEGRERARLMNLRDDLRLVERVTFAGQLEDVEVWMARAGLVVQPSRFEGFPNVVLESMGMGAPVISSNCPSGPADLIQDGINGRLVPVGDVDSLYGAMAELIAQPALRERLGYEARKVRERFHEDKIMLRWEACLLVADPYSGTNVGQEQANCE